MKSIRIHLLKLIILGGDKFKLTHMKMLNKKIFKFLTYIIIALLIIVSCEKNEAISDPPQLLKISLIEQLEGSISSGEMGDWVAIHGNNIESAYSIFFNDVAVDMEEVYYQDGILYLQIPIAMPKEVTNKVKVVTKGGEVDLDFTINIPQIKLIYMHNEYTPPGDTLKIYGSFFELYEVDSTNTVISFAGIEKPVIRVEKNYITVKVPENVEQNIKLRLINNKYKVSAVCPGFYYDRQNIITNFDDVPYTGSSGIQYVGLWTDPKPLSGKYSLLKVGPEGSGWTYLIETSFPYTDDMKDYPNKYEIKFEINMVLPIMKTNFYFYNYWNHSPAQITPSDLVVETLGKWQTIRIPLERLIPLDFTGNKDYIGSFNIRIDTPPGENVKIGWDNFRISLKD